MIGIRRAMSESHRLIRSLRSLEPHGLGSGPPDPPDPDPGVGYDWHQEGMTSALFPWLHYRRLILYSRLLLTGAPPSLRSRLPSSAGPLRHPCHGRSAGAAPDPVGAVEATVEELGGDAGQSRGAAEEGGREGGEVGALWGECGRRGVAEGAESVSQLNTNRKGRRHLLGRFVGKQQLVRAKETVCHAGKGFD